MRCKVAELTVQLPDAGLPENLFSDYLWPGSEEPDIVICPESYRPELYPFPVTPKMLAYMESGRLFSVALLQHQGLHLHASAVALDGKAYLFSAPSGTGKSTHTRLWQSLFGNNALVFNDDKPALRQIDGRWFAYGTPWCGKDGINKDAKVPLAGICFLKQAKENRIRRLSTPEAVQNLLGQTIHRFRTQENMDRCLERIGELVQQIPIFELENRPEQAAARLSSETMRKSAEEMGL